MSKVIKAKDLVAPAPARKLSAGDLKLQKYDDLDSKIKAMTKERDELKEELKHQGSHSTQNWVCAVTDSSRTNPPSLKKLEAEYGPGVKDLCTVSEFKLVKVSKKGGAE
jgi:hypothetical protein